MEKALITKERKTDNIFREKDALARVSGHPYFITLYYTFQDAERLCMYKFNLKTIT